MAPKPPRLTGRALAAVRAAAETPGVEAAIREVMRRGLRVDDLARLPAAMRGELRVQQKPREARLDHRRHDAGLALPEPRAWPHTARSLVDAFTRGKTTPMEVAERALAAIDELARRVPSMNIAAFADRDRTRREAGQATARYKAGNVRGPLDGVPMLIKDEFD